MIFKIQECHITKYPKHRVGDYKCPVVIWNNKGQKLFIK